MAIKYIDMELGRNKPVLNPAYAFNPTGTVTRIFGNGVEHGLQTGEQVVLSAFTAWLNGTWTITVVDAFSFDLDGATWATTTDFTGVSTPASANANDGSTWALATKGELNVSTDDTVYVAKSPDPVSLGQNVTFTNKSNVLTLTSAVTLDIDQANVNNWTAVSPNSVALLSTAAYKKLGSGGVVQLTKNAAFTSPGKMAYRTLPSTLDLSSYSKISFYFGANNISYAYQCGLKVCLCSDSAGDTIVDEFFIPALSNYNNQIPFVLTNGVPLGSSINSIAIYMTNTYSGTTQLRFNHFFACNDVTLHTLISKTNSIFSEQLAIQSITGTTIIIDEGIFASKRGYYGTTETVPVYIRKPVNCFRETISLTANTPVSVLFGVNKSTDLQDGETWLRSAAISATGIVNNDAVNEISNVGFINAIGSMIFNFGKFKNIQVTGSLVSEILNFNGIYNCENIRINNNTATTTTGAFCFRIRTCNLFAENKNIIVNSNTTPALTSMGMKIDTCDASFDTIKCNNNSVLGIVFTTPNFYDNASNYGQTNYLINVEANENSTSDLVVFTGENTFVNLVASSVRIRAKTYIRNSALISNANDYNLQQAFIGGVLGANRAGISFGTGSAATGYAEWQTAIKQGNDPGSWKCLIRNAFLRLAEIPVTKDVQITIRAWFSNRLNAENSSKLIIRKRNSPEIIAEDIWTLIPDYSATTWQEKSLTFTPLETGIIVLEFLEQQGNVSNQFIYIGSISMT